VTVALTDEQHEVVKAEGDFLLLACPGSGKTRTAAARIARLDEEHKRVAACSYTNVGADRIAAMLASDHRRRFVNGTLHGFLLRYVVYPFAHLAGAQKAVRLWSGDWPEFGYDGNHHLRLSLDRFRIGPNGDLIFSRPPTWAITKTSEVLDKERDRIIQRKRGLFQKQGVLSTDDAMWIALRLLREQSIVTTALAGRFDELLIDEAQDTSDVQLSCLEQIRASGRLDSMVMFGDLEQSIYAYQGASAKACRELAEKSNLRTISLSQNHRSSQKLCDVASHFCGRNPDKAIGPNRDCSIDPEVYLYPPDDPEQAVRHFRERLDVHGIDIAKSAVLGRSNAMIARLGGHQELIDVSPAIKAAGELAAALASGTLGRHHLWKAEALISRGALDKHPTELEDEAREHLARTAHRFIGAIPSLSGDLRSWILGARVAYGDALKEIADPPKHQAGPMMRSPKSHEDYEAAAVFTPPPPDLVPRTVHSLKGEEREAVAVIVKKHHGADRAKQMQFFESNFSDNGIDHEEEEERRINYVAVTRAERFCLIAFPDDARGRSVVEKCKGIGFAAS
jgi:superfamily I DNA/RNA helicase